MTRFFAKSMFLSLAMTIAAVLFAAASAQASSSPGQHTPKIQEITDVTKTSIVVPFKIKRFANEEVSVKVIVRNMDDRENTEERIFTTKLDDLGDGKVTVKGLQPGTEYRFKVRVNESSLSHSRGGMTAG